MTSSAVTTGSNPESIFLRNLALIDRLIALIARRHALGPSDAEEFGAWAREKIIDDDYAVIRKFGGRSSLSTYLTTVLVNLFRDYRNARWGRWRPSAEAKRRGPIGIRLEELIYRDGHQVREAVQILQSIGTPLSDTELLRIAAALPARRAHSEVSIESVEATSIAVSPCSQHDADDLLVLEKLLHSLVASLPAEDAVIMRMRFWSEMSVAEIARTLRVEQKPLYRRLDGIQANLRAALETCGVDRARAIEILGDVAAK
jgi:RNA polymerase sigma factor for flagellar operon FliA